MIGLWLFDRSPMICHGKSTATRERGQLRQRPVKAEHASLGNGTITQRVRKAALRTLPDWEEAMIAIRELPADQGPGVAVTLDALYEYVTEVVADFGKLRLSVGRSGAGILPESTTVAVV